MKLSANVEPIPEAGMETNAVLGNSQHVTTIGGLKPDGRDGTNELTFLILDAFEQMGGSVNQLAVRISEKSPDRLVRRTVEVFGTANGIAVFNDDVVIPALMADGMSEEDSRDCCIVGCIETSGQSDTHGCPGGHELTLPAVLMLTLSQGRNPPPAPGQQAGLAGFIRILENNFEGHEVLRQHLIHRAPKYGTGDPEADRMAVEVVGWINQLTAIRRNIRGGRYRVCYYSYGNHVIEGIMLGATPDGRKRGEPISNGISPVNLIECRRALGVSSSNALENLRGLLATELDLELRITLVPGFNDSADDLKRIADWLEPCDRLPTIRLQPFHRMAAAKQDLLQRTYPYAARSPLTRRQLSEAATLFAGRGLIAETA